MAPTRDDLIGILKLPLVDEPLFDELLTELSRYRSLVSTFRFVGSSLAKQAKECSTFWNAHKAELKCFYMVFQIVSLCSASSAPAERLFAMHNRIKGVISSVNGFRPHLLEGHPGSKLLEESLEASVLLPFNLASTSEETENRPPGRVIVKI